MIFLAIRMEMLQMESLLRERGVVVSYLFCMESGLVFAALMIPLLAFRALLPLLFQTYIQTYMPKEFCTSRLKL